MHPDLSNIRLYTPRAMKQGAGGFRWKLLVTLTPIHEMNIHRKGATPAYAGQIALIPGSMGDHSYVAVGKGHADWLWSCSHGAGRAERRKAMCSKKVEYDKVNLPWQCITLK